MSVIIFPVHYWTMVTNLSKNEVVSRINEKTVLPSLKDMFFRKKGVLYRGRVSESGFIISKVMYHRNPFIPVIIGDIMEEKGSVVVNVKFRLHYFALFIMVVWFSMAIIKFIFSWVDADVEWLIMGIMLFAVIMYLLAFNYSVRKEKKTLEELLLLR